MKLYVWELLKAYIDYDKSCGGNIRWLSVYLGSLIVLYIGLLGKLDAGIPTMQQEVQLVSVILLFVLIMTVLCIYVLPGGDAIRFVLTHHASIWVPLMFVLLVTLTCVFATKAQLDKHATIIMSIFGLLAVVTMGIGMMPADPMYTNMSWEQMKSLMLLIAMSVSFFLLYHFNPGSWANDGRTMPIMLVMMVLLLLQNASLFVMPLSGTFWEGSKGVAMLLGIVFLMGIVGAMYWRLDKLKTFPGVFATSLLLLVLMAVTWLTIIYMKSLSTTITTVIPEYVMLLQELFTTVTGFLLVGLGIALLVQQTKLSGTQLFSSVLVSILLWAYILRMVLGILPAGIRRPILGFGDVLWHFLMYLPCLLGDAFARLGSWFLKNDRLGAMSGGAVMLMIIVMALLALKYTPNVQEKVIRSTLLQGGQSLANDPMPLSMEYRLPKFQVPKSRQFAVSFWCFLKSVPPNTNKAYAVPARIISFGEMTVEYWGAQNQWLISKKDDVIYESGITKLQRWTYMLLNIDGETIDVFVDGVLVSTLTGVSLFEASKEYEVVVGQKDGLLGQVCNVVAYQAPLTKPQMSATYELLTHKSPPTLR